MSTNNTSEGNTQTEVMPEWSKEYEFSNDRITWRKYRYIGLNPIHTSTGHKFVIIDHIGRLEEFTYIRYPVVSLREKILRCITSMDEHDPCYTENLTDKIMYEINQHNSQQNDPNGKV